MRTISSSVIVRAFLSRLLWWEIWTLASPHHRGLPVSGSSFSQSSKCGSRVSRCPMWRQRRQDIAPYCESARSCPSHIRAAGCDRQPRVTPRFVRMSWYVSTLCLPRRLQSRTISDSTIEFGIGTKVCITATTPSESGSSPRPRAEWFGSLRSSW